MRMLGRTASVLGLACLAQVTAVSAQTTGFETFKWYLGGQAGATVFETPAQTRGGIVTGGAHILITAKRTGLLLSVDQGFSQGETSSMAVDSTDVLAVGGRRLVKFNDFRKYTLALLAFPFKSVAQPYFGVGVGYLHTVTEFPQGTFATTADAEAASAQADRLGGYGFGTAIGGVQVRVSRFMLFGQYQITSGASSGKLLKGPTHAFLGGLRIGLGSAREGVGDRGGS